MDAIINILKPSGMTSHDVVSFARKLLPGIKIGHTGTLDPAASGVLPLCLGKATRISSFLLEGRKGYRGEMTLGIETDSLDSQGKETLRQIVKGVSINTVNKVLSDYCGEIEQVPPAYSAIHYLGRRSYEWAHEGKKVSLPPRKVNIFSLTLVEFIDDTFPRIIFDVECSHGTYIRSLALQIGQDIGYSAHLSFLLRTHAGPFKLNTAITLEKFQEVVNKKEINKEVMPMDYALQHIETVTIIDEALNYLIQGNHLFKEQVINAEQKVKENIFRIYDTQENFWGLGRWEKTSKGIMFKPFKLLRSYRGDS